MSIAKLKMALALVPIAIVGCAATEPNQALEQARVAVQSAGNDPAVLASAPVELNRARQSLETAQSVYEESGDKERTTVEHQAYLAKRYAEIAVTRAATQSTQSDIENAQEERNRVLLQARSAEAQQSQLDAQRAEREAQAAQSEARELEQQLAELQAEQTERGLVLTLGDVLFDTDNAQLKAGADNTLDRLAQFMQEYPERTVVIEGHTDSTGSGNYNQLLSERRANAVRDALLARSVDIGRIRTLGVGEDAPVASNDTAAGRQQNRRVEIIISDEEGRVADASFSRARSAR